MHSSLGSIEFEGENVHVFSTGEERLSQTGDTSILSYSLFGRADMDFGGTTEKFSYRCQGNLTR